MKEAIPHSSKYFAGEEWVLGKQPGTQEAAAAGLQEQIRKKYYEDFVGHWRTYVKSASAVRYTGVPDAVQKLGVTSGAQSPLLGLLCVASENTSVDEADVSSKFQPVQAVVPAGCTSKYTVQANQAYMGALVALQTSLEAVPPGDITDAAAAPVLQNALQAKVAVRTMAQGFRSDSDLGGSVQRLLEDPITYVEAAVKPGAGGMNEKGKALCTELRPILNKFPFNPKNKNDDATVQEFNKIFQPNEGAIWAFYKASLAKYVSRQGAPVPGSPIQITPQFRAWLAKAAAITDGLYAGGSTDPHFQFMVKPNLSGDNERVQLTIGGKAVESSTNATLQSFAWPGKPPGIQELRVRVKGGTEFLFAQYPGVWGVFHFVREADRHSGPLVEMTLRSGQANRVLTNPATGAPVVVRLDITADPPVFDDGYFANIGCVAEVARQ
jgi:type VI protein secretion system component VasK